jgi:hypothetical protein
MNNNGLSDKLKKAFPGVNPALRPKLIDCRIPDPNWLSGFVDGEPCFYVSLAKDSTYKLGWRVQLRFLISQHIRDEQLIKSLANYLDCGKVFKNSNRDLVEFVVKKFSDLSEKIIPFFDKYPLQSSKVKNLDDFKKVVELMKNKAQFTQEGIEKIKQINQEWIQEEKEIKFLRIFVPTKVSEIIFII